MTPRNPPKMRRFSTKLLPSATVVTAGYDPLRDEGDAYAQSLVAVGVIVEHVRNPKMTHGFFWMKGVIDHTQNAYDQIGLNLRRAFALR